ncbi:flavoprotein [Candidatus Frankia nodulisporulans]|uniref:flavoprotein n=1 Tax=Candidatus Frankia nodulisporulans TaxID=2060052 RepID=UPI0013D37D2F|nr:flavoprotein [Candidatus Frankia nodulisporulans]
MTVDTRALYIVVCGGGYPADDVPDFVSQAKAAGWDTRIVATPASLKFLDTGALAELTGYAVRSEYVLVEDDEEERPIPDAVVVAPATFNTVNKFAGGISDTLALSLLNETIGSGIPIIIALPPNPTHAKHPAFLANIATLRSWGVQVIFDYEDVVLEDVPDIDAWKAMFPWKKTFEALEASKGA